MVRVGYYAIFSSLLCVFPLIPKYLPQQPILKPHQPPFVPITLNLCTQNCVFRIGGEVCDTHG
jgi:hypothetical protein